MKVNLKKCVANGLIMGSAIFVLERYLNVEYWVAFLLVFVTCTLVSLVSDVIFPDEKRYGGKFYVDKSNTGKIICRVSLDMDPTDYKDGEVVRLKVEHSEELNKGVDINA